MLNLTSPFRKEIRKQWNTHIYGLKKSRIKKSQNIHRTYIWDIRFTVIYLFFLINCGTFQIICSELMLTQLLLF